LYVFDDAEGGGFLGEYEVTAAAANSPDITLSPALKLRASELQRIAARKGSRLTLYEVMPADNREIYAEAVRLSRDALAPERRDQANDADLLANLFPKNVPAAVQQEFAQDGKPPAGNVGDPSHIWRRVKVLKGIELPLSDAQAKAMQDAGQQVELDEKTQKPKITIPEGTIFQLDPQSAQEQIAAGNVERVVEEGKPSDQVYQRELRDYARVYRDMSLQIEELVRVTDEATRQNAAVTDSQQKVNGDIAYRQSEKTALSHDFEHYTAEQKLVSGHAQALDALIANLAAKASEMKASNEQLQAKLASLARQTLQSMSRQPAPTP